MPLNLTAVRTCSRCPDDPIVTRSNPARVPRFAQSSRIAGAAFNVPKIIVPRRVESPGHRLTADTPVAPRVRLRRTREEATLSTRSETTHGVSVPMSVQQLGPDRRVRTALP